MNKNRATDEAPALSATEMAKLAGLSVDTLRWYERDGILPPAGRDSAGRRRYGLRERDLVLMLTELRKTGMTTAMMKEFVRLLMLGSASHGRRISLLEEARKLVDERRERLDRAAVAMANKIEHYEQLILQGLDCAGAPVPEDARELQMSRA